MKAKIQDTSAEFRCVGCNMSFWVYDYQQNKQSIFCQDCLIEVQGIIKLHRIFKPLL